uniref:Uncharacterized protein n=1 Tax=Hyaloperonospora arabidopsidis (strain Emoy2) TaxID=559515 RepID=M4C0C4_HYAAE
MIPRLQGYVSDGSRRYKEWQTLAFEATTVREEEELEAYAGPLVDRPTYEKPTRISTRPDKESETIKVSTGIATRSEPDCNTDGEIQDEYTVGEINEVKDVISTKGSCAANAIGKSMAGPHDWSTEQRLLRSTRNDERRCTGCINMLPRRRRTVRERFGAAYGCATRGNDIWDRDNDRRCPGRRCWGTLIKRSRGFSTSDMEESSPVDWERKRVTPCSTWGHRRGQGCDRNRFL